MSFSPSAAVAGRLAAEAQMTLTLAAYSPNGTTTDADGYEVPAFTAEGSTFGKVQGGSLAGADTATRFVVVGGVEKPVLAAGLHIPVGATVPLPGRSGAGWEYLVTAVGPSDDPALLGRRYLVVEVPAESFATARRLHVVEV